MRWITLGLIALLTLVQAELWFGKGGVTRMVELQRKLDAQKSTNEQARRRNEQLAAELAARQLPAPKPAGGGAISGKAAAPLAIGTVK